jgi:hypothetical protein
MSEREQAQLDEEDQEYIRDLFYREIVPKLIKLHARNGMVGCEFAGPRFSQWQIQFRSRGQDFDIVDFEYDEEGCSIDLDL